MDERYDVIQIEDSRAIVLMAKSWFKRAGMSYYSVRTLEGAKELLESGTRASKAYIVDGLFPRSGSVSSEEFLAWEAIDLIKRYHSDARLILYSDYPGIEEVAQNKGVELVSKRVAPKSLVERVQE